MTHSRVGDQSNPRTLATKKSVVGEIRPLSSLTCALGQHEGRAFRSVSWRAGYGIVGRPQRTIFELSAGAPMPRSLTFSILRFECCFLDRGVLLAPTISTTARALGKTIQLNGKLRRDAGRRAQEAAVTPLISTRDTSVPVSVTPEATFDASAPVRLKTTPA